MNALLIFGGLALALTGMFRAISNSQGDPIDGAIQIRKEDGAYWVYKYVRHPGWRVHKRADSLEQAREIKARDESKPAEEAKVIE